MNDTMEINCILICRFITWPNSTAKKIDFHKKIQMKKKTHNSSRGFYLNQTEKKTKKKTIMLRLFSKIYVYMGCVHFRRGKKTHS